MSTYIRGPVCGVSNCPSRLWRIIDGRRTCQYGHVMEGDVEFNNEEDEVNAGVVTRRLNLTTSATGNFQSSLSGSQSQNLQRPAGGKKIYGSEANILFLKAFQLILKQQSSWLIREMNFPTEFDQIVKLIWMQYLKWINEEEVRQEPSESNSSDEEESSAYNSRMALGRFQLNMLSAVTIMYMAAVHLGLPAYTSDFVKWIASARFPYYKAIRKLPETWREKLPSSHLRLLEGEKPPNNGQIQAKICQTCFRTKFLKVFNGKVICEGLVLKLTMLAVLPPEFYFFTVGLITNLDIKSYYNLIEYPFLKFRKYNLWPELRTIGFFLLATRWLLMSDKETYPLQWIQSLSRRPHGTDTSRDATIDELLTGISSKREDGNVFEWSKGETSQYLKWIEDSFLSIQPDDPKMKIDHRIAKRKLLKIFPIDSDTTTSVTINADQSNFVEQLQEKYLYFLSEVESHWNEQIVEDEQQRLTSIMEFEKILIKEIAIAFALSMEQIVTAVQEISKWCSARSATNQ